MMKTTLILLILAVSGAFAAAFPTEQLPAHITLDQETGERADWAPTGSSEYIFVNKPGGQPFKKIIATGEVSSIMPPDCGNCQMWRIYYLKNGDYLMTIGPDRGNATIQIISKDLDKPAWDMGVIAHEGVAVSRHTFQIAWTDGADIHYAEIVYGTDGVPTLEGERVVLNVDELKVRDRDIPGEGPGATVYLDYHEPQNWRPPHDRELIFSRYGTSTTGKYSSEVWMWNMDTDEVTNMSNRHAYYDEPEGVFPAGDYTLVECDMYLPVSQHAQILDLYMMKLDGTGEDMLRLTHFGDYDMPGSTVTFKANQGVVSEDGKYMLFGEGRSNTNDQPGTGFGIYLFDFVAAGIAVNAGINSGTGTGTATAFGRPAAFELNGSKLSFTLDEPGPVRILLHGADGRLIDSFDRYMAQGFHRVPLLLNVPSPNLQFLTAEAGGARWNTTIVDMAQ